MDRQEWLKNRKKTIGSSDAPAVHDESPYMTPLELYEDKTSETTDEESNFATEMGNRLEPIARKLFAAQYNLEHGTDEKFLAQMVISEDLPILSASLDGCTRDLKEALAEFKYQGKEAHEALSTGVIKRNYWIQVQHQLLVTGAKCCYLVSYNPKCEVQLHAIKIFPDQAFFLEHVKKCSEFWNFVQTKTPPPLSSSDFKNLNKKGAKALAKRMIYLKEKIAELEEEYEAKKTEIVAMCDHPKMRCAGLRIQQQTREGSIQYKNIPEVKALDKSYIENYRGKSSTFYVVKIEEE